MTREQRLVALKEANVRKSAKAELRRRLEAGEVSLADVLNDPPECVATTILFDLLRMRGHRAAKLQAVNRRAIHDGVNLAMTVGQASERTRRWLLDELAGVRRPRVVADSSAGGPAPGAAPPAQHADSSPAPVAPPVGDFQPQRRRRHARTPRRITGSLVA